MIVDFQPVHVDTGSPDEEGRLVFVAGRLVAVLVLLSDQHGMASGRWYLEQGFGRLSGPNPPPFADLDTVKTWVEDRFKASPE